MIGPYGVGAARGPDPAARTSRGRARTGGFSVDDGAAVTGAASAETVAGTEAIGGAFLLGLQEREADEARDRAGRKRLNGVMAELRALQRDVLRGGISRATLDRLEGFTRDVPVPADPALAALLAAGLLRARLELARYEAFRPRREE